MNKPMKHDAAYWGSSDRHSDLLAQILAIGPILQANAAANDDLGELKAESFAALKPLRMSHIFAPESLGGARCHRRAAWN